MEQLSRMHSAEHLLNSTMVKMFGCRRSFSAHINKKKSKCDYRFERELTPEELIEIESRINRVIKEDLPVREEFMDKQQAEKNFDLTRLPEPSEDIVRIISIGDYDAVPCSGTHVQNTGQIGYMKLISSSFEHDVLRIRFKLID